MWHCGRKSLSECRAQDDPVLVNVPNMEMHFVESVL